MSHAKETPVYEVGDWVRFYQSGKLVLGAVEYITKDSSGHTELNTDCGSVWAEHVFEVRHRPKPQEKS